MKNKIKKGFTLAELLIALGVVGILVAILMPVIFSIIPDQNAIMAKKAYYTVQSVVSEMINDGSCYPDQTHAIDPKVGFDDPYGYIDCEKWGGSDGTESYINEATAQDATHKFITLFADRLDLKKGSLQFDEDPNAGGTFTTKDGMVYRILPIYKNGIIDKFGISIDVNGRTKPDCGQSLLSMATTNSTYSEDGETNITKTTACSNLRNGFDKFAITVEMDGTINIEDEWALKAVEINDGKEKPNNETEENNNSDNEYGSPSDDDNNNGYNYGYNYGYENKYINEYGHSYGFCHQTGNSYNCYDYVTGGYTLIGTNTYQQLKGSGNIIDSTDSDPAPKSEDEDLDSGSGNSSGYNSGYKYGSNSGYNSGYKYGSSSGYVYDSGGAAN